MTNEKIMEVLETMKTEQIKQGEKLNYMFEEFKKMSDLNHDVRIQRMEGIVLGHDNTSGAIRDISDLRIRVNALESENTSLKAGARGAWFVICLLGAVIVYLTNIILK